MHVLGTPPAFVLSQDQTLHRDLRSARSQTGDRTSRKSESHHSLTRTICDHRPVHPEGIRGLCTSLIDVQPIRLSPDELPALAFGSHYSVFKERPGTHQSSRCWCRVCRRTVPDELLRRRVSFGCRRALGRPFRRECHDSRLATERQRVVGGRSWEGPMPCPKPRASIVAGHPPLTTDTCSSGRFPCPGRFHTKWWHAGGRQALRMPPGARSSTGFPLPPCRQPGPSLGSVHCLLMPSINRMSPRCDSCIMDPRCCSVVTRR